MRTTIGTPTSTHRASPATPKAPHVLVARAENRTTLRRASGSSASGAATNRSPRITARRRKRCRPGERSIDAACNGCHRDGKGNGGTVTSEVGTPTVRVYVLSDLAGALEPCGCQKDMLGCVDHFAALVSKERDKAPNSLVVAAGPTFFEDPF